MEARLRRIAAGDRSAALVPRASMEAQRVIELLDTVGDLPAQYALGRLCWFRYQELSQRRAEAGTWGLTRHWQTAVSFLSPCFVAGMEELPEPLLPSLADAAAPEAHHLLQEALDSDDPNAISSCVDLWQRCVDATPAHHPERATRLNNLGFALQERFQRSGSQADLAEAIRIGREAIDATPAPHPERALHLNNVGFTLRVRFWHTGSQADLDEATALLRAGVAASSADDPDRARSLTNLGIALRLRFWRTGSLADLDEAIDVLRAAVNATPADHAERAARLNDVGFALRMRFERTGNETDLNESVRASQDSLDATPADHPERATHLNSLGLAQQVRARRTGNRDDLDTAVDTLRAAAKATPTDHPDKVTHLNNLGFALRTRFGHTGNREDLDTAVDTLHAAVNATSPNHPERALHLYNLGIALRLRAEHTGSRDDWDVAVDMLHAVVNATPADHPEQAAYLDDLGVALRMRSWRTDSQADLDEAIRAGRDAVDATPTDDPERAGRLHDLAIALRTRFWHTGSHADLDEAIHTGRDAVDATPADHPERAGRLSDLGMSLRFDFERTGSHAVLDEAVEKLREGASATPTDHPGRAANLSLLADVLRVRFEHAGSQADLDEAIRAGQDAVDATPANHPDRALHLNHLGLALQARSQRAADQAKLEALDGAVEALRAAVNATPTHHTNSSVYLTSLGLALRSRYERVGVKADIDNAIETLRAAVDATPTHHTNGSVYLNNLGSALRSRYERVGVKADIDNAIETLRAAVDATPTHHTHRASHLNDLGEALRLRTSRSDDLSDLDDAVSAHMAAWECESAAPSMRIRAARAAAELLATSDTGQARAANVLGDAVRLLPEVTPRRLARTDQQHALGGLTGLAGDAAALALADARGTATERAARALRLLEAGRAVLHSQALDIRSDLADLHQHHPGLAARFVQLRDTLDQPAYASSFAGSRAGWARVVDDRHRLARDFAQTLAEIRSLKGFGSFALPPTTEELLTEAEHGPVVVFNISRHRSDALLLTADGIAHQELPQLTAPALTERIASFHQALDTTAQGRDGGQRRRAQHVLVEILEWLWDAAAAPVLDALGHHQQPTAEADWPRVWWTPGGLLGQLPLHAAGYHADPADHPERRTVIDRVVSSYTPTVRALRHARQQTRAHARVAHPDAAPTALIVAMPTTPGLQHQARLPHIRSEVATLRRHLPGSLVLMESTSDHGDTGDTRDVPCGAPTKNNVVQHLSSCPIAHFACHGTSQPVDPSQSQLVLLDHAEDPLTVASLAPVWLDRAQLAYLSACSTAAIDTADLVDEAIHLTSAFQLAGFPHVIGTLWEINDLTAVTVADAFYSHLHAADGTIDTSRAAHALHHAVRALRDGHDMPGAYDRTRTPSLWAAYLHTGA